MPFLAARRACITRENCRAHISCKFGQRATDRDRVDHHRRFGLDPDTGIPGSALPRLISLVTGASAPLAIWVLRMCGPGLVPAATGGHALQTADHASSRRPMPLHGDSTAGPDFRTVRHLHAQGAASRHPDQVLVELSTMDQRGSAQQPRARPTHATHSSRRTIPPGRRARSFGQWRRVTDCHGRTRERDRRRA